MPFVPGHPPDRAGPLRAVREPFRRHPPARWLDPSGVIRRPVRARPARAQGHAVGAAAGPGEAADPSTAGGAGVAAGTLAIPLAIRNVVIRGAA